jgi:hypothetical protein
MSVELDELVWSAPTSKKPSSGKPRPKWQERKPGIKSLGQTRLDRTWQERSPTQFQEYVRWRTAFLRNPAYTTAWLEAWAQEVALAVPRVQAVVDEPPATWTGAQWDQAHETLLRLQGQAQAVEQTLKERGQTASFTVDQVYALAGRSYAPGSKPSTCFAETGRDPFASE